MQIIINEVPGENLEDFADKHGLVMVVNERTNVNLPRFYAQFQHAEVKEGACLASVYGNGKNPTEAIKDYANKISHALLVIDAMTDARREIRVPRLKY